MSASRHTTKLQGRPLLAGEVLLDHFPDGRRVLGGAPFNVAWHLQGFGLSPLLVSRVGRDADGERVLAAMSGWGMDIRGIQRDDKRPTGRVEVGLQNGQPSFDILNNQAWDLLEREPVEAAVEGPRMALACLGSLASRHEHNRHVLHDLVRQLELPLFVDINLRPPWWSLELVAGLLEEASWLKLSDSELIEITGCAEDGLDQAARRLLESNHLQLLVLTRGERGAGMYWPDGELHGEPPVVDQLLDTVGAGDAFSAVTLFGLLLGWSCEDILQRALEFSAHQCSLRGATSDDPELYAGFLTRWIA